MPGEMHFCDFNEDCSDQLHAVDTLERWFLLCIGQLATAIFFASQTEMLMFLVAGRVDFKPVSLARLSITRVHPRAADIQYRFWLLA
jgi:hypothetical protein